MAITPSASGVLQEITFSSATTPPTSASSTRLTKIVANLGNAVTGDSAMGDQYVTVHATMSGSAATATIVIFKSDADSVGSLGAGKFTQDTAAIAATTTRQSLDTGAGDYVATVTFLLSGKNTYDLGKHGGGDKYPAVYIGCTVLSAGTLTLRVEAGRAV